MDIIYIAVFFKVTKTEPEFEEYKPRLKIEMRLKYGCFQFKLKLIRRSIKPVFLRISDAAQIHSIRTVKSSFRSPPPHKKGQKRFQNE